MKNHNRNCGRVIANMKSELFLTMCQATEFCSVDFHPGIHDEPIDTSKATFVP